MPKFFRKYKVNIIIVIVVVVVIIVVIDVKCVALFVVVVSLHSFFDITRLPKFLHKTNLT